MSEMHISGLDEIEVENTPIDELDSEMVNLIFVGIDGSISMARFSNDMASSLTEFKDAIQNSKEADEILVARGDFRNKDIVIGGYKPIDEFKTDYHASGMTPLHDIILTSGQKLIDYMEHLRTQGMRVKAVFAIFSDGEDTSSTHSKTEAKKMIEDLNSREVATAFIAFGNEAHDIGETLKFNNILKIGSSASELRKAFNVLSKSVIESSKSVVNKVDNFFV